MARETKRRRRGTRGAAAALSKADERLAAELAEYPDEDAESNAAPLPASGDNELDAFMTADVVEGKRVRNIQPHRVLLTFAVVLALGWLLWPTLDELKFHFSDASVVDLGSAVSSKHPYPENVYARVSGVLSNKAATVSGLRPGSLRRGPIQVRQLLGAPIYVEFDQEAHLSWTAFTQVTVTGRLVPFGHGEDLRAVSDYFSRRHHMEFPADARLVIVGEKPGEMWRYPIAWVFGVFMMLMSIFFLLKSMRQHVVTDD